MKNFGSLHGYRSGVTNGVPVFQKACNTIVDRVKGIPVDIVDLVIAGATEPEHDKNLAELRLHIRSMI